MSDHKQKTMAFNRRELLAGATGLVLASSAARGQITTPMSSQIPLYSLQTEFVYEAIVDIEPGIDLGNGPLGPRAMVPIIGGSFEGPNLRGTVLAGGADRQQVRQDGVRTLDALYEMQTDDGAIITVRNQVLSIPDAETRFSFIQITAPEQYGWLNKSIHVGTLNSLRPGRDAVLIRAFRIK
jgi:hypothetical protein